MSPLTLHREQPGDPQAGPLPGGRMRALTASQAIEALGLVVGAVAGGVGLARILGAVGWPRVGGYLGWYVIGALLAYTLGVYGYRWAPRAAAWKSTTRVALMIGVMVAVDFVKAALR